MNVPSAGILSPALRANWHVLDVRPGAGDLRAISQGQVGQILGEEPSEVDNELRLTGSVDLVEASVEERILLWIAPAGDVQRYPCVRLGRRVLRVESINPVFELRVVGADRQSWPMVAVFDRAALPVREEQLLDLQARLAKVPGDW